MSLIKLLPNVKILYINSFFLFIYSQLAIKDQIGVKIMFPISVGKKEKLSGLVASAFLIWCKFCGSAVHNLKDILGETTAKECS